MWTGWERRHELGARRGWLAVSIETFRGAMDAATAVEISLVHVIAHCAGRCATNVWDCPSCDSTVVAVRVKALHARCETAV